MTRVNMQWPKATLFGAAGPQPAKRACLPQGLGVGARSAPHFQFNIFLNFRIGPISFFSRFNLHAYCIILSPHIMLSFVDQIHTSRHFPVQMLVQSHPVLPRSVLPCPHKLSSATRCKLVLWEVIILHGQAQSSEGRTHREVE